MRKKEKIEIVNRMNVSMFVLIFIIVMEITSGGVVKPIQNEISKHGNFLKILNIYNGELATFFDIETDVEVFVPSKNIIEDGEVFKVYEDVVTSDVYGVVVSILDDDTGGTVLIKSIDDTEYEYKGIDTVSVTLYDLVKVGDIIGNGVYEDHYKLKIKNI